MGSFSPWDEEETRVRGQVHRERPPSSGPGSGRVTQSVTNSGWSGLDDIPHWREQGPPSTWWGREGRGCEQCPPGALLRGPVREGEGRWAPRGPQGSFLGRPGHKRGSAWRPWQVGRGRRRGFGEGAGATCGGAVQNRPSWGVPVGICLSPSLM